MSVDALQENPFSGESAPLEAGVGGTDVREEMRRALSIGSGANGASVAFGPSGQRGDASGAGERESEPIERAQVLRRGGESGRLDSRALTPLRQKARGRAHGARDRFRVRLIGAAARAPQQHAAAAALPALDGVSLSQPSDSVHQGAE